MSDAIKPIDAKQSRGGVLTIVDFGEHGNSAIYRREGWSGQEPRAIWGLGPRSVLRLTIQPTGRPVVLDAEIDPCRQLPNLRGQIVRVRVNGTAIGAARLDQRSMIRAWIPPSAQREDGVLEIEFGFPGFLRPKSMRYSGDIRPLSGLFSFVRAYTQDLLPPGPWCAPTHSNFPVIEVSPPATPLENPPDAKIAAPAIYRFGAKGTVVPFLREGWDPGETEFTWTRATCSRLELPAPDAPGTYVMRLEATPLISPEKLPAQELTILLDGIAIGQFTLNEATTLIVPLPRELTDGRETLPFTFLLPDASRPKDLGVSSDLRLLGLAVRRIDILPLPPHLSAVEEIRADQAGRAPAMAASRQFLTEDSGALPAAIEAALGMDPVALLRGFESLGDNCEFGMVQRKLGLEVLNLLRFGNAHLPDLMRALTDDLQAATDPAQVRITLNDGKRREYVLALPAYNLRWHTFTFEDESDAETVLRAHSAKLGYLRRKFYEGLRGGRKIYVMKRLRSIPLAQATAVLIELSRHGNATLLCVEPAPEGRRPGEVDLLMPGLMRGYVARFAPASDVGATEPTDWLRVAANAVLLTRGTDAVAGASADAA